MRRGLLFTILLIACGSPIVQPPPAHPVDPCEAATCLNINGGFEDTGEWGEPLGWSSTCGWGVGVRLSFAAATEGAMGLRMSGQRCDATSPAVTTHPGAKASADFSYRLPGGHPLLAELRWLNTNGGLLTRAVTELPVAAIFTRATITAPRPEGGELLEVRFHRDLDDTAEADVDDVKLFVQ